MPISVVFDPPLPSDSPSTFNTKAFTLLGDLNDWSTQANALPGEVATNLSALLASPPAIGGTTPAAGSFTTLSSRVATDKNLLVRDNGQLSLTAMNNASNAFVPVLIEASSVAINSNTAVTGALSVTKSGAGYQPAMLSFATPTETSAVYRIGMGGGNLIIGRTDTSTTNVTLDASGNLGLGVTPSAWWTGYKAIDIGYGSISDYPNSSGTQIAANAFHSSNDAWSYKIGYYASMYQQSDGKHSWYTAPSGTAGNPISFTQAMTLDASGNLLVGTTSIAGSVGAQTGLELRGNAKLAIFCASDEAPLYLARRTSDGSILNFRRDTTPVGSVSVTSTATAYNTSSDARLKENINDAPAASDLIDAIQVRQFDWKSDGSHQRYGMVAQELFEVAPEAVSKPADPDEMMAVDYSKLVPMMVKEIQSLRRRVAAIEAPNVLFR